MAGKDKNRTKKDRRRVSVTWLALAVLVAVAASVGASALLLPDRSPQLLGTPHEVTSAPASIQQYDGSQQVTVIPTMSASKNLILNATGTVTADYSGAGLNSGKAALEVNGREVLALATSKPLYRDLKVGDQGDDVRALNDELNRLGYASSPGWKTYTQRTANGWKRLLADAGDDSDGNLLLADVLWIPAASVQAGSWTAATGSNTTAGATVATVPGTLARFDIKGGQASDRDRTLSVLGQTITLPAGTTGTDDAAFCAAVAATPDFQAMLAGGSDSGDGGNGSGSSLSSGIDATVALTEPVQALRVPAAAVFGVDGTHGCLVPKGGDLNGTPTKVSIIGSQLGVSLVTLDDGVDPASVTSVALGSAIAGARCS